MTDDLVAFLRARLDEVQDGWAREVYEQNRELALYLLRGVEAKRQVLDLIVQSLPGNCDCEAYGHHTDAETALRLLATDRSDHPDYREEWKP